MAENQFYPPLSELIPTHKIPESLGPLKTNIENVLHNIFYKNFIAEVNQSGDTASYKTTLVSYNRIDIEIFESGLFLVLNPGRPIQSTTEIPISLRFSWPIKRYIVDIQDLTQNFDPNNLFFILLEIIDIEPNELLIEVISVFIDDVDPIQRLITDINEKYFTPTSNPGGTPIPTISGSVNEIIDGILNHLESQNVDLDTLIFDDYLFSVNSFDTIFLNLKQLFNKWIGDFSLEDLKDFIIPQVNVSLDEIKFALEFPRSIFQPLATSSLNTNPPTEIGELLPDTFKTQLIANIGSVSFNSKSGFIIDDNVNFNFDRSIITGTGFTVEFSGLKLDLSENTNIPEATADGRPETFKGVYAETATIGLPKGWVSDEGQSVNIIGRNLLIGNPGGISGTIGIEGGILQTTLFGNTKIALTKFDITFVQNEVTESSIEGNLQIAGLKDGNGNDAEIQINGQFSNDGFEFSGIEPDGVVLNIPNIVDIRIFKITIGRRNEDDKYYIGIKADFDFLFDFPLIGKFIPDEANIDWFQMNSSGVVEKFDFSISWDGEELFSNQNEINLDKTIYVNKSFLEILFLSSINTKIKQATGGLDFQLGVSGAFKLGPVMGSVVGFGIKSLIEFPQNGNGNLGLLNIEPNNFKLIPPKGIALKIKTGSVDGDGFISLDKEKGLYSGGLELEINNKIQVTAIGLLVTKLPSGNPGYSFIALINASFPDVPLGFGFTLSAVGAVLGLNRGMDLQVIQNKVYSGTINDLLFPTDVVNKSDKILTDINGAFPVAEGRFVIGLLANIAWGYPKKIIGEIGLMVELPSPIKIALLGKIHIVLPDPFQTKLILNIAFLGAYDAEKKTISFDACLYDSRFSNYTLSGDLSFRHVGGENPNFLLTAGGFHPSYTPPPLGLPSLRRLTVNIINKQKIKVDMQAYLALTSNTAQVGASVTLFSQITDNITADGYLGFDALFQFHPFYFTFEASAQLAVKRKSKNVLSINVNVKVQGPNPWSVYGNAEFEVCGLNLTLSFNETWGNSATNSLQDVAILPLLIEALNDKNNWNVDILDHKNQLVTFREIDSTDLIVQPTSILSVKQNVVPFKTTLASFGTQKPSDGSRFMISKIYIGPHGANDPVTQSEDLTEYFAPAQFLNLSISEKLSRKSFEKFPAGVKFKGTENLAFPKVVLKQVEYETIIVDKPDDIRIIDKQIYPLQAELAVDFDRYLLGNDVSTSSASNRFKKPTPTVVQNQERFVITNTKDLQQESQETFDNMNDAFEAMLSIIQNDPKRENQLQVMSEYELV